MRKFSLEINHHQGLFVPKNQYINYLIQDKISAFEVKFAIQPAPRKGWVNQFAIRKFGLGYYQGQLGNKDILGDVKSLVPFIQLGIKSWDRFQINTNIGVGIAMMSKYFHPVNNYSNKLIGSKYNAHIKLGIEVNYAFSHFDLASGIVFSHFSNGSRKHPNDGLNIVTGSVGINYKFGKTLQVKNCCHNYPKLKSEFTVILNQAWKQENKQDPHTYYVANINISYTKGINSRQRLGIGIDLFYDESVERGYWTRTPKTSFKNRISQAVFLSHELAINKVSFITQIGTYTLYNTKPNSKPFYNRLGLRYKFSKHFLANFGLKGYLGNSDFIEMGIGYYFNKK
ncbi:acyloxyacyl hydrolase [Ancylomarina sp. DW003]|nr:acyloxyacyl hydrolase [Ancylomarina sp. DW003]MDE5423814.1 acyloxyacyl hydrolase [Ancylomarina sp. DW003]